MIDFHTHILPRMDDGAKNVAVSAEMLKQEYEQGVKEILFTPHYYGKQTAAQFLSMRAAAYEDVKPYLNQGVKARLGAEILITGVNDPTDDALCAMAIEGTKCVLFELPYGEWNERLLDRISSFIADTGYSPVIAHVERYKEILNNPAIVTMFVNMGCYIQVNVEAFFNKYTKGFVSALLKHGLIHCLGSDAHNDSDRAPNLKKLQDEWVAKGKEAEWDELQWCMRTLLSGERLMKPYGKVRKFAKWYF
jgi:protein-tyrosine phosphatase